MTQIRQTNGVGDELIRSEAYALFCRGALPDPHPPLHELRQREPVNWSPLLNAWLITRCDDVLDLARDTRAVLDRTDASFDQLPLDLRRETEPFSKHVWNWLGMTDLPKHTRLRQIITHAFTPKVIRKLEPRIRHIALDLLDRAKANSNTPDLKTQFADRLPATVICEMLDIPTDMHEQFCAWTLGLVQGVEKTGPTLIEGVKTAQQAYEQMCDFMMPIIHERRKRPGQDLMSLLAQTEYEDQRLNDDEMLGMSVFLFVAGHETMVNLLAKAIMLLLSHLNGLDLTMTDETVMSTAIEEALRYESSITFLGRASGEDMVIRGQPIRKGQIIMLMMNAANRDPPRFADADRFDVIRRDNKHVAFGWGIHLSLGAPLARCEAAIAFDVLFKRYPKSELVDWEPK